MKEKMMIRDEEQREIEHLSQADREMSFTGKSCCSARKEKMQRRRGMRMLFSREGDQKRRGVPSRSRL
jgi:hypothetical protein